MSNATRILHFVNNLSDSSISRIVERIIAQSDPGEWEWQIAYAGETETLKNHFLELGVTLTRLAPERPWRQLREILYKEEIQLVHSHTPRTILDVYRAARAIPAGDRPVHLATKHLLTGAGDRRWGSLFAALDTAGLYLPDHLVTVSQRMARQVQSLPGLRAARVTAIPNGIPCETFDHPELRADARREFGFGEEEVVFGFCGRLDPVKRVDVLLAAASALKAHCPQVRLLILGEGQMMGPWQAAAEALGLAGQVCWPGFRTDMARMLAAMDVYVQPSGNEGLSLSILEAMSAGRAVIATAVGAADEVLEDGVTGLIVPPGSAQALSQAMFVLANHEDVRHRLAEAARAHVYRCFHVRQMVAGYHQLYRRLIGEHKFA